jgi:hypothetical protein
MSDIPIRIPRSGGSGSGDDPLRQLGVKVQEAIDFAAKGGSSIQISHEDIDHGLVFLTARVWRRRG